MYSVQNAEKQTSADYGTSFSVSFFIYSMVAGLLPLSSSCEALSERLDNIFQLALKFLAQFPFLVYLS